MEASGLRLRDLDSRNGTVVDGLVARDVYLRDGSEVPAGTSVFRLRSTENVNDLPVSERTQFGPRLGKSVLMRRVFALLERAAAADSTVLIEGEIGTGKEGAAAAIHDTSARATSRS
jgi:transcriptional regulator with PAS, ATPase and Fis domain